MSHPQRQRQQTTDGRAYHVLTMADLDAMFAAVRLCGVGATPSLVMMFVAGSYPCQAARINRLIAHLSRAQFDALKISLAPEAHKKG